MIFSGLVGATLAGLLIDYTKLFKEVAVVSLSFGILSFIWFTEVRRRKEEMGKFFGQIFWSLCKILVVWGGGGGGGG